MQTSQLAGPWLLAGAAAALLAAGDQSARPSGTTLTYIPRSTVKVSQLLGEVDKERERPTSSRTVTRYGLEGTDLGSSFEHDGRVYFLFGDTVGTLARALDTIAVTDATDPESDVRLDFLTMDAPARRGGGRRGRAPVAVGERQYLTIEPPGISMGPFEVPVAGLSLNGRAYVVVSTNHSDDRSTDRSVLTTFTPPERFTPGRTISQLPDGHFVKLSLHTQPASIPGLPSDGPFVFMWGTGRYRQSDAYFAIVPSSRFEDGRGTRYLTGLDASGTPAWSERESDAVPIVKNGTMGDLSVTWCQALGLWLMTYDSRPPAARGVLFSYSRTPWGPWSEPQTLLDPIRDGSFAFVHDPRRTPPDGLAGPVIGKAQFDPEGTRGSGYAPYVIERWTRVENGELTIYYVLSTWNPYVVVLMKSRLRVQ